MPKLYEWKLPLNPPDPYANYLRMLAPAIAGDKAIYYSKYILGIIGELTPGPKNATVREFEYPQAWRTGNLANGVILTYLARHPKGDLWFNVSDISQSAIGVMTPATGKFGKFELPGTATAPLASCWGLRFDGTGKLWFMGGVLNTGVAIARLDPKSRSVTYWTLPASQMLNAQAIYPNAAGTQVWVASSDGNQGSTGGFVGMLDVAQNAFTSYRPKGSITMPASIDVALDEARGLVWFPAAAISGVAPDAPKVYRYDIAKQTFFAYDLNNDSWPRGVALQNDGSAWVADIRRSELIFCSREKACGTVDFIATRKTIRPKTIEGKVKETTVKPTISSVPMSAKSVSSKTTKCTTLLSVGTPRWPDSLIIGPPLTLARKNICYADPNANTIALVGL